MSTGTANFLSGGLSAFAYWIMAIPADNVKKYVSELKLRRRSIADTIDINARSRIMATPHTAPVPSFTSTVRSIYATTGLRGFVAGLSPCLLRAFPSNACAFYAYEGLLRLMGAEKVPDLVSYRLRCADFCAFQTRH